MIGIKNQELLSSNTEKVALIDADSLLYFSSYGCEEDQILSETKLSEKIYDILNILTDTYNIEKYYIFVKGKDNFRYKIFSDYKKGRPKKHPIIETLAKYLVESFGAIESHQAESDDYVFTYSQMLENKNRAIICSVDKDMLQIPGIHYDYQKNKFIYVTDKDAMYNLAIQMIMGDAADGIQGLRGYGIKKAEKLLDREMTKYQYIKTIYKEYLKNCFDPKNYMRLNYKLLKLCNVNNLIEN